MFRSIVDRRRLGATASVLVLLPVLSWQRAAAAPSGPDAIGQASGQDTASTPEAVVVVGRDRSDRSVVAKTSSAANKTDTPLIDAPESVSTVTRAQLDQQNARTVTEALRYTAGVSGDVAAGYTSRFDLVEIRGFQGATGADEFVDGLRLFSGGYYQTQQIDPYLLDRIDVLKGPPSVIYGQSSPGGAIALTTKQPTPDPVHMLSVEGGTYGYLRGTGDYGGRLDQTGHWLYRLAVTGTTSGTQDLHTRDEHVGVLPSVRWQPDDRTDLTVSLFWQHDPRGGEFATALAVGTVLPDPHGLVSRHFYSGDPGFETFDRTQAAISAQFGYRLTPDWTVQSLARYANVGGFFQQVAAVGPLDPDDRTLERITNASEEHFDTISLEEHLLGRVATGPVRHRLLFGVNWQNVRDTANLYAGLAPPLDVYAPVYGQPIPPPSPLDIESSTTNQEGLFAEDQMSWGNLHGQVGVRHDWSDIAKRDGAGGPNYDQADQATTWRAGVLYAIGGVLSPYFNYAQSFQPPNALAYDGALFRPIRGRQYEAGLKVQPHAFNGFFTLAFYDLQESQALTPDPVHAGFNVQTGGIRSRGVEAEAHLDLSHGFDAIVAYAYQDVAYTAGSGSLTGERPTDVPRQTFSVWGHYTVPAGRLHGLGVGVGARYNGNTLADNALDVVTPSYTLVDLEAQYALGILVPALKGAVLQVTAQNAFDKLYYPGCYSAAVGCYIGANRNVIGKLTYAW